MGAFRQGKSEGGWRKDCSEIRVSGRAEIGKNSAGLARDDRRGKVFQNPRTDEVRRRRGIASYEAA